MRVLIVNLHFQDQLGGSEIQCDLIAKHLQKFGHEVLYYAVNGTQEIYETEYSVVAQPLSIFVLRRAIRDFKPDIVYWRYGRNHLLLSTILMKNMRVKIVFSISHIRETRRAIFGKAHDFATFRTQLRQKFNIRRKILFLGLSTFQSIGFAINYLGIHLVDGLISLNDNYRGILPVKQQITIHNSMPLDVIPFQHPRPYIVWVASLKPAKNPHLYIELARRFEGQEIDFIMIGKVRSGDYAYVERGEGLPSNLKYLGQRSVVEVNGILKNSLFLVHTCDPEGFGNNFIQAWLQSKPTISLYYDPEGLIEEHELGYLAGDFESFVQLTRKLIDDEALRQEMGTRAQQFAAVNFHPEHNIRKFEAFFKQILASD